MAGSVTKLGALAICQTCQLSELTGSTGARRPLVTPFARSKV